MRKGHNNKDTNEKSDTEDCEPSKKRKKLETEEVKEGEIDVEVTENVDEDTEPEECIICLIEMKKGEEVALLPCMHVYHKTCIDYWFKHRKECPIDRARHL